MTRDEAESVAASALAFLAGEEERLTRFAALTGVDLPAIQDHLREATFLAGVLDYMLEDESLLLAFVETESLPPEAPSIARNILARGKP